jgi:uncharacterized protein (TIGR00269 family)
VIDRPYDGSHPCERHFRDSVRDRFRREMHKQFPRFSGGRIAVALSGGKDSAVALSLVHGYFARRPGAEIVAITVDEGIEGYRSATIRQASALCERLGVTHQIVSAKSLLGTTTDETALRLVDGPPCGYCGVWRRQLLNRAARDAGAAVLVLGFNLDDLAQTVLMNLARADVDRLVRMAPHRHRQPGLVPRIAPLASIPEREVFVYATLAKIPFDHGECPYAGRAARNVFREVIWRLEEELPGTRHALMRTRERLVGALEASGAGGAPGFCRTCGEPATGVVCRACQYKENAPNPFMEAARS